MSAIFSFTDAEKKIEDVQIETFARHMVKDRKQSLRKLSLLIGKDGGFIKMAIRRKNMSLPLLYALTVHLKVNMFEPFINQLPDNLRTTQRELALQNEIASLQQQLADVTKERDLLKAIVMK